MIETKTRLVDVVVDVQTAHLDEPFTYAAGEQMPAIGARVRVQLGGRLVSGWVVGSSSPANDLTAIKPIAEVCDDDRIPPEAVELARWMRRRYACTFREALAAVAPRASARADRFAFVREPAHDDDVSVLLYRRFALKEFSALAASRALRAARRACSLNVLRRKLLRGVATGVVRKVEPSGRASARASSCGSSCGA